MGTFTNALVRLNKCIKCTPPGSIQRLACILDCYLEGAREQVASKFPEDTPPTVQTICIPPNGKDIMEVFFLVMDLLPPEQFICIKDISELTHLEFRGKTLPLCCKSEIDSLDTKFHDKEDHFYEYISKFGYDSESRD